MLRLSHSHSHTPVLLSQAWKYGEHGQLQGSVCRHADLVQQQMGLETLCS